MPQHDVDVYQNILTTIGIKTHYETRDPTAADVGFRIPTLWINTVSNTGFLLIANSGGAATWLDLGDANSPTHVDDFYAADTAPPGAPVAGDSYILDESLPVDAGWTAVSATNDDIVVYGACGWVIYTPVQGKIVYDNAASDFYIYDGTAWGLLSSVINGVTYITLARPPRTTDNTYTVPTVCVDSVAGETWMLSDITGGVATWVKIGANHLGDGQDSVLSRTDGNLVPPTEVLGNRYIIYDAGGGVVHADWDGAAFNSICEFDGATWVARAADEGMFTEVEDEDTVYIFIAAWEKLFKTTGATFITDSGNAVPDESGLLNVVGGNSIATSGAASSVTVKNLADDTKYVVDSVAGETGYTTIQSAINAANAAGGSAVVYVRPGAYTENLTLYTTVKIKGGDSRQVVITGTHIPPAAGTVTVKNVTLLSTTHAFSSAVAGTATIVLKDIISICTNGYTLNLPNWGSGDVYTENVHCSGTNDGFLNNTGDISLIAENSTLGIGSGNTMIVAGEIEATDATFVCPITLSGSSTHKFKVCEFNNNLEFTVGAAGYIESSYFNTGANIPLSYNTTADLYLTRITFNTTNTTAIDGTGAGTVYMGVLDFLKGSSITGTFDYDNSDSLGTSIHGWNGSFIELADITVAEAGGVITASVEKDGGGNLTLITGRGYWHYDTTPADTVTLTAGTDEVPVLNYVYLLGSNKTLTSSIVGFPATGHSPIATILCQSAASLGTDAAYKLHSRQNHIAAHENVGHIGHINNWIRGQHATWQSGVAPTFSGTGTGTIGFSNTAGQVLQLHEHVFPLIADPSVIYCVNDPDTKYRRITNIADLLKDSAGVVLKDKAYAIVFWGCVSEDTGDCKIYCNLPSGSEKDYNKAREDKKKYINYSIPEVFKGTGFLIYRLVIENDNDTTWDLDVGGTSDDIRGQFPNTVAGSSTAIGTEFPDSTFIIYDDGDDTKEIAFQASGITTANTRTITMADADIDLTPTTGSYQASDAGLTDISALAVTDSNFIVGDGVNWVAETGATARTSLGLGTIATQDADSVNIDGGAIDGTIIGGTTPAAATATTLSAIAFDGAFAVGVIGGWVSNLGITYTGSVLSVTGADGTALSAANPGYVIMQDKSSPGQLKKYTITADQGFIDDTGASEIISNLFGLTTSISHADAIPFFIYAVTNDAETAIAFMIGRVPSLKVSPAAAYIGAPDDAVADVEYSLFSFDNLTEADYESNPCVVVGSFRMTMSASDDWTVSALDSQDGIGQFQQFRYFIVSVSQFTAATGKYWRDNAGTAPAFTSNYPRYTIDPFNGEYTLKYYFDDCSTAGVGAVTAEMAIPFRGNSPVGPFYEPCGHYTDNSAGDATSLILVYPLLENRMRIWQNTNVGPIQNGVLELGDSVSIFISSQFNV